MKACEFALWGKNICMSKGVSPKKGFPRTPFPKSGISHSEPVDSASLWKSPLGSVLKELSHRLWTSQFEVFFGGDLSTLPTGTTAAWGMRYPARTLLMLTIPTEFPVNYGH